MKLQLKLNKAAEKHSLTRLFNSALIVRREFIKIFFCTALQYAEMLVGGHLCQPEVAASDA